MCNTMCNNETLTNLPSKFGSNTNLPSDSGRKQTNTQDKCKILEIKEVIEQGDTLICPKKTEIITT